MFGPVNAMNAAEGQYKRRTMIAVAFAAANTVLLIAAVLLWFNPAWEDYATLRQRLRIQETRYAAHQRHWADYEANRLLLDEWAQAQDSPYIVPYGRLTETMARLKDIAGEEGLREIDFFSGEPVVRETGFGLRLYTVQATVAYGGDYPALVRFFERLAGIPCHVDGVRLTVGSHETTAWVSLSFYGVE
jgi:hypothetical protein